jgi:hypothetical protein
MKVTKEIVAYFEEEQETYGTEVAISNILWNLAAEVLRDLGVRGISTIYNKDCEGNYTSGALD